LTCAIVPAGAAPFLFPRDGNDDEDDAGTGRKKERERERGGGLRHGEKKRGMRNAVYAGEKGRMADGDGKKRPLPSCPAPPGSSTSRSSLSRVVKKAVYFRGVRATGR